ncbi:Bro-N domain-containing protein [Laribacter hongkongensis]|uniref:BRO-N domain-containing protein n=1 Tax=Laribacter hongkongensis TaxID=168471 RepID=UPI001EFE13AE|nr:Bro-N domain-containing protein [Laribacter hongkongensis]MCG9046575.1 Bro-N domain-containing protein [Laribacter hongkongensis]
MLNRAQGTSVPSIFSFESHQINVRIDEHGDPWFIASEICSALGIRNPRDAVSRLDEDEKGVAKTDTPGGAQEVTTISEPGLYRLIGRSNKPAAKRFNRWVCHEVLPAIRKTGTYSTTPRRSKASREAAVWLSETEAFNLAGLLGMLPYFKAVQQKAEKVLRAAESPLAPSMFDAWHETEFFCGILKPVRDRCKPVQARLSAPILRQNHL